MPFVGCCALVYFWTLRFSRIGDFYTLRLGFFGNLDLRIIIPSMQVPLLNIYKESLLKTKKSAGEIWYFSKVEIPGGRM